MTDASEVTFSFIFIRTKNKDKVILHARYTGLLIRLYTIQITFIPVVVVIIIIIIVILVITVITLITVMTVRQY